MEADLPRANFKPSRLDSATKRFKQLALHNNLKHLITSYQRMFPFHHAPNRLTNHPKQRIEWSLSLKVTLQTKLCQRQTCRRKVKYWVCIPSKIKQGSLLLILSHQNKSHNSITCTDKNKKATSVITNLGLRLERGVLFQWNIRYKVKSWPPKNNRIEWKLSSKN